MAFVEPVTLAGTHVAAGAARSGARGRHSQAAAADGELWKLWYTSVPAPEATAGVDRRGAGDARARQGALPFVVRAARTAPSSARRATSTSRRRTAGSRSATRGTRSARSAAPINTECKLLLLTHAFETLRVHRRRVPHALLQFRVARRDRAAGREAGRHPAQSPDHAGRHAAATPSSSASSTASGRR